MNAQDKIALLEEEVKHLRSSRNRYKQKLRAQEIENQALKAQIASLSRSGPTESDSEDSGNGAKSVDVEDTDASTKNSPTVAVAQTTALELASEGLLAEIDGSVVQSPPKRYPSRIDYFHGDYEKWESWRLQIEAGLQREGAFSSERERIRFVLDHCKGVAFDIVSWVTSYSLTDTDDITALDLISHHLGRVFGPGRERENAQQKVYENRNRITLRGGSRFDFFFRWFVEQMLLLQPTDNEKLDLLRDELDVYGSIIQDLSKFCTGYEQLVRVCRKWEEISEIAGISFLWPAEDQ